jgi:hypothetical protein
MLDWLINLLFRTSEERQCLALSYRSPLWPRVRAEHLEQEPECQVCGSTIDVEVHHKIPVHIDQSKELDALNLITLCQRNGCHYLFGHARDWKAFNPRVVADCSRARSMIVGRKYSLSQQ